MKNKTRVLVTHQVEFLHKADLILVFCSILHMAKFFPYSVMEARCQRYIPIYFYTFILFMSILQLLKHCQYNYLMLIDCNVICDLCR